MNKNDTYKRIRPLMEYYKQNKTIDGIKQDDEFMFNGEKVKIGWIITNLRQDKRKGLLSDDVIEILDYMGINWNGQDSFRNIKKILLEWYKQHNTLANLTQYSKFEYNGEVVDIGEILHKLRQYKKENRLSVAQVEFLEMLDVVWAPNNKEIVYDMLVTYKKVNGTIANISIDETFAYAGKNCRVGKQINHLRTRYNKGLLDPEEIKFFESLGMVWSKQNRKPKENSNQR